MADVSNFFQVSGTLTEDAPSYVERPADEVLYNALTSDRSELCLVLAPRQSGKSSLIVHVLKLLAQQGMRSGYVDLQRLGKESNPDRFFNSVMRRLQRELGLKTNAREWATDHDDLSPTERFALFIEEVVLAECPGKIVLSFDEVDSILKLPFSDDFFTTIRSLYNARAINSDLNRLKFVLLGTATKSAFIKDRSRTPFNIGSEIALTDFDQTKTESFKRVLGDESGQLIDRIFYWTGGQPLLVQRLAAAAYSWPPDERTPAHLDQEVTHSILKQKVEQDTHLKFIRDYLLSDRALQRKMLLTYGAVLDGVEVAVNNQSLVQDRLKLAGVIRVDRGRLLARNRIYSSIFNYKWVGDNTPPSFADWQFRHQVAVFALPLLFLLVSWFLFRPYFYPRLPVPGGVTDQDREMYTNAERLSYKENEEDSYQEKRLYKEMYYAGDQPFEVDAGDAVRAFLDGIPMDIRRGYVQMNLKGERPGLNTHTLRLEGQCAFTRLCFGESRTVKFRLAYYPGGEMRRIPDPMLAGVGPFVEVVNGKVVFRDVSYSRRVEVPLDEPATAAALLPGGKQLLVGSRDGTVTLWFIALIVYDPTDSHFLVEKLSSYNIGGGEVRSLAIAPDASAFISGHADGAVRRWAIESEIRSTGIYQILSGPVDGLIYGPGGFIASSGGRAPKYYDEQRNEGYPVFGDRRDAKLSMAFSPDGTLLATGGSDGKVMIWELTTGTVLVIAEGAGGQNRAANTSVDAITFSPDGNYLLWEEDSQLMRCSKLGGPLRRVSTSRVGRPDRIGFSNDGKAFFVYGKGGELQVWDWATGYEVPEVPERSGRPTAVAFSPDGKLSASADDANVINLWDAATGELKRTLHFEDDGVGVSDVAFAPDGQTLVAGGVIESSDALCVVKSNGRTRVVGGKSSVMVWNVESGQLVYRTHLDGTINRLAIYPGRQAMQEPESGKRVSGIPPLVAAAGNDGKVYFIKLGLPERGDANGEPLVDGLNGQGVAAGLTVEPINSFPPRAFGASVNAVAFSGGNRNLTAAALGNGTIELFSLDPGQQGKQLTIPTGEPVHAMAFSSDGRLLASDNGYSEVLIWDVQTGALEKSLSGAHTRRITALAFSPDMETIASGSLDTTVRLWDVKTGKVLRVFERHTGVITDVAFSPDSNQLVSASDDYTIRFWWAKLPDADARTKRKDEERKRIHELQTQQKPGNPS